MSNLTVLGPRRAISSRTFAIFIPLPVVVGLPLAPLRDHRSDLPFRIDWLIEPLEKLQYLTKHLNPLDRAKWRNETTYLIDRIKDHEKGSQP